MHEWKEHFALTESEEEESADNLHDYLPDMSSEPVVAEEQEHTPTANKPSLVIDPEYKNKLRHRK